jgi:SAM-dependent methyltransferase
MSGFEAPAEAYDRFMGRYAVELAPAFADFAGVTRDRGMALDVGCGPGALTEELARRVGARNVAAVEPSDSFAAACADRVPGADVRNIAGEELPWGDGTFAVAVAQLVVSFMRDAPAAVREMSRVTTTGGTVAACTWDAAGGMEMLRTFWTAARSLKPDVQNEASSRPYMDRDSLSGLFDEAGLDGADVQELHVTTAYEDFDDFWEPFLAGVGPAGAYAAKLDLTAREELKEACFRELGAPAGPFELRARAWAARATV